MASIHEALGEHLNLPFPASTKQVAGHVEGVKTEVMVINFSDKIMLTVTQEGRLSHWVREGPPHLNWLRSCSFLIDASFMSLLRIAILGLRVCTFSLRVQRTAFYRLAA